MRRTPAFGARTALALLCIAVLAPAAAGAAVKTIGQGIRLRGSNIWYAHGTAVRPAGLAAAITVPSPQPVKVQWAVVCQKPNKTDPADHLGTGEKGGQVTVQGNATVRLALPYPKPPTCVVTVYATLSKADRVSLRLLQT